MKSRYILLFIIFYCHYSLASDYWITSNNPRVFYSNEWKQLPIISPKINVFKFYYQVIQRMPTSELRSTLRYLKKNNIKLAIEVPGLVWVDHGDGYAVEGYGPSFFHKDIAHRIKVAGGTIDYIAIDEVIFYGHFSHGTNNAKMDVKSIATQAAENTNIYYKYFPSVKIGIIEPLGQIYSYDKLASVDDFIRYFDYFSEKNLSFVHYDVLWGGDIVRTSKEIYTITKKYHMKYGVIFNDNSNSLPGVWMSHARVNVASYFDSGAVIPQDIIVQSWNLSPKINFSTTDKDAMSTLVPFISKYITERIGR